MTGLRLRKPSASMIVALIALFVALGGSSYAAVTLARNSVGSKQLKKNAVTTSKIKNHAVTAGKINPAGLTAANAQALGGTPAAAFEHASQILTAVVTNNGTTASVLRGTSGTTALRNGTGEVFVTFPRDVSQCTWIATQGNGTSAYDPSDFATVRGDGNPKDVEVITYTYQGSYVNDNFHLLVVC